ncbi:DUF3592 domain-containing protein [Methylocystis sp. B8]|uniref:DUF3592 domain-containing protein n=1 Tax=Methylocystis sp. B8 TaxID=544938 RepID=UPI0010FD2249|nr:DUF3592 domain-containing protein [Methylocystis sp. B8]TLG79282.1 hypothetical protein FEV16_04575 [Methylocystis sp. B8]
MTAAGVFAFLVAATLAYITWQDLRWVGRATRTVFGEVRGHRVQGNESGDTYSMIVQFADDAGNEHIFVDGVYKSLPWLPRDAVVEVIYPEGSPELARVFRPRVRQSIYFALIATLIALLAVEFDLLPQPLASMF